MPLTKSLEKMLELPLFQGMSKTDMNKVLAHTPLGFENYSNGKTIVEEGSECTYLYFLLRGNITAISKAYDNSYRITETLSSPDILQPECLFGFTQRFTKSFVADGPCQMVRISKREIVNLSDEYQIFRINILNMISTQSQRVSRLLWRTPPKDIRSKIIHFVGSRCIHPAGEKILYVKMEDLGHLLSESRLNISRELNKMAEEKVIDLTRGVIHFHALEQLI